MGLPLGISKFTFFKICLPFGCAVTLVALGAWLGATYGRFQDVSGIIFYTSLFTYCILL